MPPATRLHPRALALETRLRGLEVLGREDERLDAWLHVSLQRAHPRLARGGYRAFSITRSHNTRSHTVNCDVDLDYLRSHTTPQNADLNH